MMDGDKMDTKIDMVWVRELAAYADNAERVYNRRRRDFDTNAMRKIVRGTYDAEKAVKLWWYFADYVRHEYQKEYGALCPKPETMEYARQCARRFEEWVRDGEITPADCGVKGEVPAGF
jgi:hypothetical protein